MRCKMKAMIMDMRILSHKTQCFLMFGHVVNVGAGKRRGLPVYIYIYIYIQYTCTYVRMYVCTYVRTYVRMYLRTYVRMYVCMYVCMYICMYVGRYVCMHVYIYIYMHRPHLSSQTVNPQRRHPELRYPLQQNGTSKSLTTSLPN